MANFQDGSPLIHQMAVQNPGANAPKTIRLMDLIDCLIQRAYHELVVLAEVELVSKSKTDMDKKIAIMMYLSRTRNYFIRFFALLEWSSSMVKVDKCFNIIAYLEEQSALFVETADTLARMSRETLANSKLPCYQVSFAVDVLNSHCSPRMPSCIKDKIVPADPLTDQELEQTLKELSYALWNRLITTDRPPLAMMNYTVQRGRVTFRVEGEFEVTLTVMGEDRTMPFRVLDLKVLVKNRRVGEGRPLVHPQQVLYLMQLLQSRIMDNDKPLDEVYDLLHTFCQNLKLEVLFSQLSKHMIGGRLDYFRIESYIPGRELKIAYWPGVHSKKTPTPLSHKSHSIIVTADASKKDLTVTQTPPLETTVTLTDLDIGTLLMSVIHVRVKSRLIKLEAELSRHFACTAGGFPCLLTVPLYAGSPRAHSVQISIDYYTGQFVVHLQQFPSRHIQALKELLDLPTGYKVEKAVELLKTVRLELVLKLAVTSATYMHVQEQQKINLYGGQPFERFSQLGSFKTAFRFQRKVEASALLAISCHDDALQPDGVRLDYHVLMVEETKAGLKILSFTTMKSFLDVRKGEPQAEFARNVQANPMDLLRARLRAMKGFRGGSGGTKKVRQPQRLHPVALDDFEQMFHHVVVQVTFAELRTALKAKGYVADATVLDPLDGGQSLCCVTLPVCVSHPQVRSCVFRRVGKLHINGAPAFHADITVTGVPFQKDASAATASCTLSYDSSIPSEKMIESFAFDWQALLGLLRIMRRFKAFLDTQPHLAGILYEVRYNLKSVRILYGPNLELAMSLGWDRREEKLVLDFYGQKAGLWNPHRLQRARLMEMTNPRNGMTHMSDFSHIFAMIAQTTPIALAAREACRPVGVAKLPRSMMPQAEFQIFPLSLTHYIMIWKAVYCVSLRVLDGPKFVVTDVGSTEIARRSTDAEAGGRFLPIKGLDLCVKAALGQAGAPDSGVFDQEVPALIAKFFAHLRGFPVLVTSASTI
ncbi:Mediator of RNA polymerase II transcription subunit 14 [Hypsibius exemplaris]|uniref:Mediator of RNA polymerase II transcription subunit 14 n=1 Tax=Hypsibius exemplaris TaxID=2072580 RepID=A0A1W0WSH5_HYPEX|nr:Mediator of RNA polymerase II transcription subunit 14 [Hypsibius exemplaris]